MARLTLAVATLTGSLAAQEAELHPQGLFATPQEGLYAQLPPTAQDPETWRDYFHLSLRASVTSESNVFLSDSENEESDTIFMIAPTLTFSTPGLFGDDNALAEVMSPRISVSYTPSYRMYSKNSDLNGYNHSFRLNFNNEAGYQITLPKTTISFDLDYDQSQGSTRFSEGIVESERLSGGINVSHRLSGKTTLNFGARGSINNYNGGNLLDDVTWNFNASMRYQVTGKISIGPYIGYGISSVNGSIDDVENTQENRYTYSAGLTANYAATGKTAFTGSVGWSSYEFDGPGSTAAGTSGDGNSTVTWRVGMSTRPSPKTSLRASLWRSYKASNNIINTAYIATGASLSFTYNQSNKWNHYATLTWENDDYFSDDPAGGNLDSDYYSFTLGSRYRFNNGLSIGANISSSTQTNSEGANDFGNLSYSIYANYVFW